MIGFGSLLNLASGSTNETLSEDKCHYARELVDKIRLLAIAPR